MSRSSKDVGRASSEETGSRTETKAARFERLAQRRVTDAVKQLRLIGNLSNRGNYDYTEAHVRQVLDALETEMRHLRQRFQQQDSASPRLFTFKK